MAEINKPSDINKIWAVSGDILAPSDSKISTGWQVEIPPRQYFNYIDNKQDQFNAHLNQHGVPVWDTVTEYQYSVSGTKSICMGSDGIVYRAKTVNTGQNPVLDTTFTNWEVAFSKSGDSFTKIASDARYAQLSNNASDFPNSATVRTNLNLYSQAQVNSLTTVATATQAQQQTSNSLLISALQLTNSFKGVNQDLTVPGQQTLYAGGFMIQWGTLPAITAGGSVVVSYKKAFTAQLLAVVGIPGAANSNLSGVGVDTTVSSLTQATFRALSSSLPSQGGFYIAIGV